MQNECTCADHGTHRTTGACTCRVDATTRYLNRNCPQHGDAEMRRRHEAARREGHRYV